MEIKKAFEDFIERSGKKKHEVRKILQSRLYGDLHSQNASANMGNLLNGKKRNIPFDHVLILCEELEITPNKLLGYVDPDEQKAVKKLNKVQEILND